MKTIGKIILAVMAIAVLFIPVVAVQQIEARAVNTVLEVEGLYVNGTGVEVAPLTNLTEQMFETAYGITITNETGTLPDSVMRFRGAGINKELRYMDTLTYLGNSSYSATINFSNEPAYSYVEREFFVPFDMNVSELIEPDFLRIKSTWVVAPQIVVIGTTNADGTGGAAYGAPVGTTLVKIAEGEWLWINTIQTRSWLQSLVDNNEAHQVFLMYNIGPSDPVSNTFTFTVTEETLTGADAFTWSDETVYIMGIVLCDVLLVGAIIFASDPIDIDIQRPFKRR